MQRTPEQLHVLEISLSARLVSMFRERLQRLLTALLIVRTMVWTRLARRASLQLDRRAPKPMFRVNWVRALTPTRTSGFTPIPPTRRCDLEIDGAKKAPYCRGFFWPIAAYFPAPVGSAMHFCSRPFAYRNSDVPSLLPHPHQSPRPGLGNFSLPHHRLPGHPGADIALRLL